MKPAILLLAVSVLPLAAQPDDRAAAEWAIRATGRVRVVGSSNILSRLDQLPEGPIRLEAVDLVGTIIEPSEFPRSSPPARS